MSWIRFLPRPSKLVAARRWRIPGAVCSWTRSPPQQPAAQTWNTVFLNVEKIKVFAIQLQVLCVSCCEGRTQFLLITDSESQKLWAINLRHWLLKQAAYNSALHYTTHCPCPCPPWSLTFLNDCHGKFSRKLPRHPTIESIEYRDMYVETVETL